MEKFTWGKCYCPIHTKQDKSSRIRFQWGGILVAFPLNKNNINLVFWGSLKWYKLEMESDQD